MYSAGVEQGAAYLHIGLFYCFSDLLLGVQMVTKGYPFARIIVVMIALLTTQGAIKYTTQRVNRCGEEVKRHQRFHYRTAADGISLPC